MRKNAPLNAVPGAAHATAAGCPFPVRGVDLHLHSTFSDGLKTPDELCAMAKKAGLSHVALCDHDTVSGLPAMREAARKHGLHLVPGVEISTGVDGHTHILCYGPGVESAEMNALLDGMAQERTGRAAAMLDRLAREGVVFSEESRAALLATPCVGRAHIARQMIAMGAVNTMQQAFDRYLGDGRPAYVPRTHMPTARAVEKLRQMRVLPVLAHPVRMGVPLPSLHALIHSYCAWGLAGVEAYHPSANNRSARLLEGIARQERLLVTGGSDFHGDAGTTVQIGRLPTGWPTRAADLCALQNAIDQL